MQRSLAFLAAILLTTVTVSSACLASPADNIRFTLEPSDKGGDVHLSLRSGDQARNNHMRSRFRAADLAGLDLARFRSAGPVAFALIREPGRIDCSGEARSARAEGACRFTPNSAFSDLLASRGMGRPSENEAFALTVLGANRGLLDALHAAKYPMPSVDDYIAMTAVGVTPGYIADIARAGYRPEDSKRLIEFQAIGITPQYLGALAQAGYAKLPAGRVIELAALDIDPEFIKSFERIGYSNLPVESLVQLKALDVTPAYAQAVRRSSAALPSVEKLVELKALGIDATAGSR
jgi:hypothetical protein